MDYSDFEISKEQAKEFAISIFSDIKSYIETHQDDYQEFLLSESVDKTEKNANHRKRRKELEQ